MVEGHSVHRIAISHGRRLCGRRFKATSPNGRFAEGAKLIDGREFSRCEAIGKNLFAVFAAAGSPDVVMHVHFGMSGRWSAVDQARAPQPTGTTRLMLEGHGLVSHLSAMTVEHGGMELFESKKRALGQDPLRDDADPDALWAKVRASSKSIGALLMDQSCFAGVGNIFRCEILLVAGVHPEVAGKALTRAEFDQIWLASVRLMRRAFTLGSIVTVFPEEAVAVGRPGLRRWLYNSATCGKCGGPVRSWQIQARTCYACARCQPPRSAGAGAGATGGEAAALRADEPEGASSPILFNSHCASEPLAERLGTPQKLKVAELRAALQAAGLSTSGKKAALVARLELHHADKANGGSGSRAADEPPPQPEPDAAPAATAANGAAAVSAERVMRSARAAAADKAAIGESRAVEHIAEYEDLDDAEDEDEWYALPGCGPSRGPEGGGGGGGSGIASSVEVVAAEELDDDLDDEMQAALLASITKPSAPPPPEEARGKQEKTQEKSVAAAEVGSSSSSSTTPPLAAGQLVLLCGLQSRADLNGKPAAVASYDETIGRWNVYADGERRMMAIREENLKASTHEAARPIVIESEADRSHARVVANGRAAFVSARCGESLVQVTYVDSDAAEESGRAWVSLRPSLSRVLPGVAAPLDAAGTPARSAGKRAADEDAATTLTPDEKRVEERKQKKRKSRA